MATVIESSVWVDFFRPKTALAVKLEIKPWILRSDAALCEPVIFELLRSAAAPERPLIRKHFATMPILSSPPDLWRLATRLGQAAADAGLTMVSLHILIATVCLHHRADLVTFDTHFSALTEVAPLKLHLLRRGG